MPNTLLTELYFTTRGPNAGRSDRIGVLQHALCNLNCKERIQTANVLSCTYNQENVVWYDLALHTWHSVHLVKLTCSQVVVNIFSSDNCWLVFADIDLPLAGTQQVVPIDY